MAETLDLDFERLAFWPTDVRLARAIDRKRTEYAGRLDKIFGSNMHPAAMILMGLSEGIDAGLVYQARIAYIDRLKEQGEAGLAPATFADEFAVRHESIAPSQTNVESRQAFLDKVMYEASVVRIYCEGDSALLTGGTGLHFDNQPAETTS